MKITIVLGTRPEIIKMSSIIQECEQKKLDYTILHTGQHYSFNMDGIFFNQLKLPQPHYNLEIGSGTHSQQTGRMLISIEKILRKNPTDIVLVQGDTNTVLAGALTSAKLGIDIGHVEAGLRSYDRSMPEEINRIVADHTSQLLFAPTMNSQNILLHEGISKQKIFMTGNTVVDAIQKYIPMADELTSIQERIGIKGKDFLLATIHRQENVDNKIRFQNILQGFQLVRKQFGFPIVYPIHPRAKKQLQKFNLKTGSLILTDPLDYFDFLSLQKHAKLILTDSGGIQEEACILGVPCVTVRENTERPETVDVGANVIAGTHPKEIVEGVKYMLRNKLKWKQPFGNGQAGKHIVNIVREQYE